MNDSPAESSANNNRRDCRLQLRVSTSEKKILKDMASDTGRSVSELLRDYAESVDVTIKTKELREAEKDIRRSLSGCHSNLNQLAKWCNKHQDKISPSKIDYNLDLIASRLNQIITHIDDL